MDDLTITRLCAEAMDFRVSEEIFNTDGTAVVLEHDGSDYDPLHDDAQCMALEDYLIEKGELSFGGHTMIFNSYDGDGYQFPIMTKQMRRHAICECVARMQQAKG